MRDKPNLYIIVSIIIQVIIVTIAFTIAENIYGIGWQSWTVGILTSIFVILLNSLILWLWDKDRSKKKRTPKIIQIINLLTEIRDYLKRLDKCISFSNSLKTHRNKWENE